MRVLNAYYYIFCAAGLFSMTWLIYGIYFHQSVKKVPIQPSHQAPNFVTSPAPKPVAVENNILLITYSKANIKSSSLAVALLYSNYAHTVVGPNKEAFPSLYKDDTTGLFSVVVLEDLRIYTKLGSIDRANLDAYCKRFGVGIIIFSIPSPDDLSLRSPLLNQPIKYSAGIPITNYRVLTSNLTYLTKSSTLHKLEDKLDWTIFHPEHHTYQVIGEGYVEKTPDTVYNLAVLDLGLFDGVRRVYFGNRHTFWLHKILFLDAVTYLTDGATKPMKKRYFQIDIDDIFIGANGTKMVEADVVALEKAQKAWRSAYVPDFRFYLGFSGKFYKRGLAEEQKGDEMLISRRSEFHWFDHTFSHTQAHKHSTAESLVQEMNQNKQFAKEFDITVDKTYAVAPHHSGVFPVHEPLYDAWKQVWGIQVTSTEEYPNLYPFWDSKGFIHSRVHVLPRQVCGLYTKTYIKADYPNGPAALDKNIRGGALFDTLLYNYVNIYMTHQQNYGNDRLAIYTFDKLLQLFHSATTLELRGGEPMEIASDYFAKYPSQRFPVWSNPCDSKRHMDIWPDDKDCTRMPSLLVVGPQKTGSTALHKFLKLHPDIVSNIDSKETFEEVQFFGTQNYYKGIDWYMNFFPNHAEVVFEKSATYFDNEAAPKQAFTLLPNAKIIIILMDPIQRALSWYHHMRAHDNPDALRYSFYEIVTSNSTASEAVKQLKSRLLKPGFYYDHITRWRKYFPNKQIMYLDGERLQSDPVEVMYSIQNFLRIKNRVDYSGLLSFDEKKGFYCSKTENNKRDCLGPSKGRSKSYGEVDALSKMYLTEVFRVPNLYLKALLQQLGRRLPNWLS